MRLVIQYFPVNYDQKSKFEKHRDLENFQLITKSRDQSRDSQSA